MSKIYVVRTIHGLQPAWDADQQAIAKLKMGETYKAEIVRPRNLAHHKKYWSLINLAFQNLPDDFAITTVDGQTDYIRTPADLHWHVKCQCGIMKRRISLGGKIMYEVGSTSFHKMDQDEFSEFYSRAVDVIIKWILPGVDRAELWSEVESYL